MNDQLNEFNGESGCPQCASKSIAKVRYTWWGDSLGPRLLHHTKCDTCGATFNGKTGKSNTNGIIIYNLVLIGIICIAIYLLV